MMFTQQTLSQINTPSVFTRMILEARGLRNCADGLCILRTKSVMLEKNPKSKPRFQRSSAGRQQSRSARSPQDTKKAVQQREPDLPHHWTLGREKRRTHRNQTPLAKWFRPLATRLHESEQTAWTNLNLKPRTFVALIFGVVKVWQTAFSSKTFWLQTGSTLTPRVRQKLAQTDFVYTLHDVQTTTTCTN